MIKRINLKKSFVQSASHLENLQVAKYCGLLKAVFTGLKWRWSLLTVLEVTVYKSKGRTRNIHPVIARPEIKGKGKVKVKVYSLDQVEASLPTS